ncbi:MAG: MerR family transcriptional regulator [Sporichthyaceae bacterium]
MSDPPGPATMHIGELAERTGMSLRTLRHYDEIGLLAPSGRTDGGFRIYTESDLQRLLVIRRMKPLGFSLAEMHRALEIIDATTAAPTCRHAAEQLADLLDQARTRRATLARQVDMADEFVELLTAYVSP